MPLSKSSPIRAGITIGDPSGIGPAITLRAIRKLKGLAEFVVIGDAWVLNQVLGVRCKVLGARFIDLDNVKHKNFKFGEIKAEYGRASVQYLDKALELIKKNEIDCMVTCPVSKEAVNSAGIKFAGHTEYLAKATDTKDFAMMLLNKELKISLVTRHIPLRDVAHKICKDEIKKNIILIYKCLKRVFLIENPRIVVCGLNPHASDNGLIGEEENKIIKPALKELRSILRCVDGPLPADVAIAGAKKKKYHAVIAMYHDQALIPLKLTSANSGANLTLGLPFIRTSPLHGTAFDIAGDFGAADPASLIEAIKLAVKCTSNLKKA